MGDMALPFRVVSASEFLSVRTASTGTITSATVSTDVDGFTYPLSVVVQFTDPSPCDVVLQEVTLSTGDCAPTTVA